MIGWIPIRSNHFNLSAFVQSKKSLSFVRFKLNRYNFSCRYFHFSVFSMVWNLVLRIERGLKLQFLDTYVICYVMTSRHAFSSLGKPLVPEATYLCLDWLHNVRAPVNKHAFLFNSLCSCKLLFVRLWACRSISISVCGMYYELGLCLLITFKTWPWRICTDLHQASEKKEGKLACMIQYGNKFLSKGPERTVMYCFGE